MLGHRALQVLFSIWRTGGEERGGKCWKPVCRVRKLSRSSWISSSFVRLLEEPLTPPASLTFCPGSSLCFCWVTWKHSFLGSPLSVRLSSAEHGPFLLLPLAICCLVSAYPSRHVFLNAFGWVSEWRHVQTRWCSCFLGVRRTCPRHSNVIPLAQYLIATEQTLFFMPILPDPLVGSSRPHQWWLWSPSSELSPVTNL